MPLLPTKPRIHADLHNQSRGGCLSPRSALGPAAIPYCGLFAFAKPAHQPQSADPGHAKTSHDGVTVSFFEIAADGRGSQTPDSSHDGAEPKTAEPRRLGASSRASGFLAKLGTNQRHASMRTRARRRSSQLLGQSVHGAGRTAEPPGPHKNPGDMVIHDSLTRAWPVPVSPAARMSSSETGAGPSGTGLLIRECRRAPRRRQTGRDGSHRPRSSREPSPRRGYRRMP